jgi:hypothetical protein
MFDRIIERVLLQLELQVRDLVACRWESLETLMNKKEIPDTDQAALTRFYDETVLHF